MTTTDIRAAIENGETSLGIEFGSTRIKAVLIGPDHQPLASGGHSWENRHVDGLWTYTLDDVRAGLQDAYARLVDDVKASYGVVPTTYGSLGISAMMHGFLAFDADGDQIAQFRTWRNTNTAAAADELIRAFDFNIPLRWSIAHLHQAILDDEPRIASIASMTTLAGWVHEQLTGRHVLGIGDASGMFPIDSRTMDYDQARIDAYDALVADRGFGWRLRDLLPTVLVAGQDAGTLTAEGAALLDPTGALTPGIPMCPPEGDAGTGMVATNSVGQRTGNISCGTSVFLMVVLEKALAELHTEIDMVTTPDGSPVAMVHSNNGASEIDGWVAMFVRFAQIAGIDLSTPKVYDLLYEHAMTGAPDGGGLLAYNTLSGEPLMGLEAGRPMFAHAPDSDFTLANAIRTQLMSIFAAVRIGMDILADEDVALDKLFGHGGLFKTPGVAQQVLADALGIPVSVGATAGEGGAWGIAVLARYLVARAEDESLPAYLDERVFADAQASVLEPDPAGRAGYDAFLARYRAALPAVQSMADHS
ncbi:FGGY-family carbohydrate kinase [Actinomyces sp. B33]|uniref:xylulokinase n=1 Tax=Actinomyces sp. B33 TaxID=2942131 RepID=UPI002340E004|nr:FGGY-family carbohydrate kinase [Actinomyces sp. B33]MDC4232352.1 FGGY-family carbohydrate kinase [Actinomyces sp. B33]